MNYLVEYNKHEVNTPKQKLKHDYYVNNGALYFTLMGKKYKFIGFEFIEWLNKFNFKDYFSYITYDSVDSIIFVFMNGIIKSKNKKTGEIKILNKFPPIAPYIKGVTPKIDNPFLEIENFLDKEKENMIKEKNMLEINESKKFKASVIALMSFFLSMGIHKTYAQCSQQLQSAMQNPNDPKNAKILAGSQVDLDKKISGTNYQMMSPEDKALLKKQSKEDVALAKQSAKQEAHDLSDKFNPKLNIQGERLSKEERQTFTNNYNSFISRNPQFKIDPSRYTPQERYTFLTKVIQEQSVIRRLNVLFNRPNPYDNIKMTLDELYKYINDPKINGFDSFTELYRSGFPDVKFPDNPHKYENKILDYNDYINENWFKKAALAGALVTSALSGSAQQKIDKFTEFKQNENINKDFKSFDEVNTWLKQNFDGSSKWNITSISIKNNDNLLNISIDRKKSNTGYDKVVLAVNKEGNSSESRDNILSKNPNSKEINSGETNFKGISYDWFLIGLRANDVNYTTNVVNKPNNKPAEIHKTDVKKGLIDAQAYAAIYKFETTKGRIVPDNNGGYKAVSMEDNKMKADNIKYNVHQKDNVIKNHIENAIGLDTWYKIPSKFRMQIFSYMFNSDSYDDKKGDRFRWIAGLAQSLNPNKFGDRQATMANPKEAIEYIKGLEEKDFTEHYKDYLDVLHSQYASLSTPNGKEYDDAAKELSWFLRPGVLDKDYSK